MAKQQETVHELGQAETISEYILSQTTDPEIVSKAFDLAFKKIWENKCPFKVGQKIIRKTPMFEGWKSKPRKIVAITGDCILVENKPSADLAVKCTAWDRYKVCE